MQTTSVISMRAVNQRQRHYALENMYPATISHLPCTAQLLRDLLGSQQASYTVFGGLNRISGRCGLWVVGSKNEID